MKNWPSVVEDVDVYLLDKNNNFVVLPFIEHTYYIDYKPQRQHLIIVWILLFIVFDDDVRIHFHYFHIPKLTSCGKMKNYCVFASFQIYYCLTNCDHFVFILPNIPMPTAVSKRYWYKDDIIFLNIFYVKLLLSEKSFNSCNLHNE